jgi:hypothetical protein
MTHPPPLCFPINVEELGADDESRLSDEPRTRGSVFRWSGDPKINVGYVVTLWEMTSHRALSFSIAANRFCFNPCLRAVK